MWCQQPVCGSKLRTSEKMTSSLTCIMWSVVPSCIYLYQLTPQILQVRPANFIFKVCIGLSCKCLEERDLGMTTWGSKTIYKKKVTNSILIRMDVKCYRKLCVCVYIEIFINFDWCFRVLIPYCFLKLLFYSVLPEYICASYTGLQPAEARTGHQLS